MDVENGNKMISGVTERYCGRENMDPLLSRKEAAKYLGVAERTLAIWTSTGRYDLAIIRIGGLVKYRRSELDRFITMGGQR